MSCRGLQRYMNEVLPHSEWAQEAMRPALTMVLRRIDKTFSKIAKKPAIRVSIVLILHDFSHYCATFYYHLKFRVSYK